MSSPKPVPAVEKTIRILQTLSYASSAGLGVSEIAFQLGYSKGTVYSILNTLLNDHIVEKNLTTSRYSIGLGLTQIAESYDKRSLLISAFMELGRSISDQCGENINLSFLRDGYNYVAASIPAAQRQVLRVDLPAGTRIPAIASSSGKILLSSLPDHEIRDIYEEQYYPYTRATIATADEFIETIRCVRKRGYAVNDAEYGTGVYSVSAPVYDSRQQIIAAINIVVPEARLTPKAKRDYLALVIEQARQLSRLIA